MHRRGLTRVRSTPCGFTMHPTASAHGPPRGVGRAGGPGFTEKKKERNPRWPRVDTRARRAARATSDALGEGGSERLAYPERGYAITPRVARGLAGPTRRPPPRCGAPCSPDP